MPESPPPQCLGCWLQRVSFQRLETLSLGLGLGSLDSSRSVWVNKTAALLAVLELSADTRTDASALAVVGAAALDAVGIGDTTTGSELLSLAVTNTTGAGGVGDGNGKSGHGDCRGSTLAGCPCTGRRAGVDTYKPE